MHNDIYIVEFETYNEQRGIYEWHINGYELNDTNAEIFAKSYMREFYRNTDNKFLRIRYRITKIKRTSYNET